MLINQYPIGSRIINTGSDFLIGLVSGQLCDIPMATFIALISGATIQGGPTTARPNPPTLYQNYFDTTLGMPIWCKQVSPAVWCNASGFFPV